MEELQEHAKAGMFFVLRKFDPFQGIAEGVAACEEKDRDNEIFDYDGSRPYFQAWTNSVQKDSGGKSFGNVRFQHDEKRPVGKLMEPIAFNDEDKSLSVKALIVEQQAKDMMEKGVITGFSIGGSYVKKTKQADGSVKYIANPSEISVVDRPCAPSATFSLVRADGTVELRKFAAKGETAMVEKKEEKVWKAIVDRFLPTNPFLASALPADAALVKLGDSTAIMKSAGKLYRVHYKIDATGAVALGKVQEIEKEGPQGSDNPAWVANEEHIDLTGSGQDIDQMAPHQETAVDKPCKTCGKMGGECTCKGTDKVGETAKAVSSDGKCEACGKATDKCACEKCGTCGKVKEACKCTGKAEASELPAKKTGKVNFEEADASNERLLKAVAALKEFVEEIGRETMGSESQDVLAKARGTITSHLNKIEAALGAHKGAHDKLHKAHDELLDAHGAVHAAHKAAHEARQVHKAAHDTAHGAISDALDKIKKVVGGGPEEAFTSEVSTGVNPDVISPSGSAAIAPKAIGAEDLKKAVREVLAELGVGKKQEAKEPEKVADKTYTTEDVKKQVKDAVSALIEGLGTEEDTKGVGDRAKAVPFTKAQDVGGPVVETMTDEDWEGYRKGNKKAMKKAQTLTSQRWQAVPSRILERMSK